MKFNNLYIVYTNVTIEEINLFTIQQFLSVQKIKSNLYSAIYGVGAFNNHLTQFNI